MRVSSIVTFGFLAACRPRAEAPNARGPAAVADAVVRAPRLRPTTDVCDDLMNEGQRALAAWRVHSPDVSSGVWSEIAAFNHCEHVVGGTWASVLEGPTGDAARNHPRGRFKLVFVAGEGIRSEGRPALLDSGDRFALRPHEVNWSNDGTTTTTMGPMTHFDFDGDHVDEVIVPITERIEERGEARYVLIWQATQHRVQPYERAMGLHPVAVDDVDGDGRPDLHTYADLVALYATNETGDATVRGPELTALSTLDGDFSTSYGAALARNRQVCPAVPTSLIARTGGRADPWASARNVSCAVLWRVAPATILASLARECAPTASDGCTRWVSALRSLAEVTPPIDLRAVLSIRRWVSAPVIFDAGVSDAPDVTRTHRFSFAFDGAPEGVASPLPSHMLRGACEERPVTGASLLGFRCVLGAAVDELRVARRQGVVIAEWRRAGGTTPWNVLWSTPWPVTLPLRTEFDTVDEPSP